VRAAGEGRRRALRLERAGSRLTAMPDAPRTEPRKVLFARLFALGAIPTAVFCAVFVVAARLIGMETLSALAWVMTIGLAGAMASLFALTSLGARAIVGEVDAIRDSMRGLAKSGVHAEIPELTPPLDELQRDALAIARDFHAEHARLQERLDHARQQIFFLTNHDPLTTLPNRKALEERLETAFAAARNQGTTHALLYLDVDFFHRINDAFGHLAGDELLRRITPVLQSTLRQGETLARIGGDEFAVLLENCSVDFAQAAATQLRDAVQAWQFEWKERAFQVTVSIGVVAITRLAPGLSAIMSEADIACLTAKEQGRNRVFAFHDAAGTQTVRKTSRGWLKRINDALSEGAFTLLYQPILPIVPEAGGGGPRRVEALLRMSETGGQLILPMSFLPVAERYDLMRTIDRWVVERAFSDYRRLAKLRGETSPAEFSINLSGHTLSSPEFTDFMRERLKEFAVPPESLYLEITETAAIANMERAKGLVEALTKLGVRFVLDDFGSGLSSFNYVRQFPLHGLKIDGAFVKGVARDPLDFAVVESVHKIGMSLGLETIAESVETEEIAKKLTSIGVKLGQGFHLCPPRPLDVLFERAAAV
jgi:diguanylate cyclase (GGDEF)-like protein